MSVSSIFGDLFPAVDTGPTRPQGGNHVLTFEMNDIETDVTRSADQSQDVFQGARAFSGSVANNTLQQDEVLVQDGSGLNEKFLTYTPPLPNSDGMVSLDQLSTALFASRFLANGRGENLQDQVGGQSAVSSGVDGGGNPSRAQNELVQEENVDQNTEAITRSVFDLRSSGDIWNRTGLRRISAILDDHNVNGNLFNRQRQGYSSIDPAKKGNTLFDNPSTQFASADIGISTNNLVQDAISKQRNRSGIETIADFRREPTDVLDTGLTEVTISMNGEFVDGPNPARNRAQAFVESIQEQALVQQSQAGFDEDGNVTGNSGVALNNAIQTVDNVQISDVYSQTDILI